MLLECLQNNYLKMPIKIQLIALLQKLMNLDQCTRFFYEAPKANPYVNEMAKYGQVYVEVLAKCV